MQTPPLLHGRHLVHVIDVLGVGDLGHVVAEVLVALAAHGPDQVVGLVHAIAGGIDVVPRRSLPLAQKRPSLHVRRHCNAGQRQHRRAEIDEAHEIVDRRPRLEHARPSNHQRHMDTRVIDPAFGAGQSPSMIAPKEDDRVVRQAILFKLAEDAGHLHVHGGDVVVVRCPVLANNGRVGVVGRQLGCFRIVAHLGRDTIAAAFPAPFGHADRAFVRNGEVEDGEERLIFRAVPPMGLPARFVPCGERRLELVIGLRVVRAVVSGGPEIFREALDLRRRHGSRPHVHGADGGRVHAGDDRRAARRADARNREAACVASALGGQIVDVGTRGVGVAVAAQVRADVLATDPQNVGTFGALPPSGSQQSRRSYRSGAFQELAAR